jgi:hypothetical protein
MKPITRIVLLILFTCIAAQSEEFKMDPVTSEDKAFFEQIKKAVLADDVGAFSKMISYPLVIHLSDKTVKLKNAEDVKKNSAIIFTAHLKSDVKNQSSDSLFKNWRGLMIGNGVIWFSQVRDHNNKSDHWHYRIIGINPEDRAVKDKAPKAP